MLTATVYDTHVEQLFDRIQQLHSMLTEAGIPYRLVGGMAVFIHASERDPIPTRLRAGGSNFMANMGNRAEAIVAFGRRSQAFFGFWEDDGYNCGYSRP